MRPRFSRTAVSACLAATTLLLPLALPASASDSSRSWVGSWAASPQRAFMVFDPSPETNWSGDGFADQSVRQVVRISAGGSGVRIKLSNAYGKSPLRLTGATVARAGKGPSVRPGSVRPLTFDGSPGTVVPAAGRTVSDPVRFGVSPLEKVTVTLYFARPTGPATFHNFASAESYRAAGDRRFDAGGAFTGGSTSPSFYYLSGVDVTGQGRGRTGRDAVVAYGDSITDGVGSTPSADNRYPDELAERLRAAGRPLGVLNQGIGGNRVLHHSPCFGDSALSRFGRDVLGQSRVRTAIVLAGINDILANDIDNQGCYDPRPKVSAEDIIDGHKTLIREAHRRGITMAGATLTPYEGFFAYSPRGEAMRQEVNHWIRTSGAYDTVVDFDKTLADPSDPRRIRPAYDSGDGIHPNDAGYRAMAAAVDLGAL